MFHRRVRLATQELELAEVTPSEIVVRRTDPRFAGVLEKKSNPRPGQRLIARTPIHQACVDGADYRRAVFFVGLFLVEALEFRQVAGITRPGLAAIDYIGVLALGWCQIGEDGLRRLQRISGVVNKVS